MKFGIGYTFIEELKKQHYDLQNFSKAFEQKREEMESTNSFSFDKYIKNSSDSSGLVGTQEKNQEEKIIWCTNHYLGLNRDRRLLESGKKALEKYGAGSGTSAMSGGRSELHFQIEEELKAMLGKKEVLLFSTGYTANLGMISTIVQKNDVIISDSENHASILDGIKLSGKNKLFFEHNNLDDLRKKLVAAKAKYQNIFLVIESAYSMSGDLAPLKEIVELKKEFGFYLYLDEAHTFGFYGENGKGLADELGVLDEVDFYVSTFSKSCASIGGFCAMSAAHRTFLMFRSSPYIFQASLPPVSAATILAALKIIQTEPRHAQGLHEKNAYMRRRLKQHGFDLGDSSSPIIPIYIPDIDKLLAFEKDLYAEGVFAVSIMYPAVKPTEGRIRMILNQRHTYEEIDKTIAILTKLALKYGMIEKVKPQKSMIRRSARRLPETALLRDAEPLFRSTMKRTTIEKAS
ncbi:aminotransferase class I/II-fold pyridoxal phosphate-dependent enzyme [Jiulongibacter sp. NS-SX5]|uniref:aminotransferase class I/II-fold pyridoxal phosphate-dependent enzyme n=1 Tax=Jiulongibacter sp. NS-SX5 TaxID=3463854 RepID=UPI004059339F